MKHVLHVWCFIAFFLCTTNITAKQTCLFSPEDKPTKKLIDCIKSARTSIHAAMYLLTDKNIAQALINAKKEHAIDIKIVLDPFTIESKFGKGDILHQNGIDVFVFNPGSKQSTQNIAPHDKGWSDAIMHNKYMIIDGAFVWTGSFNWTVAANEKNCENVLTTDDRDICKQYEQYFSTLIEKKCSRYTQTDHVNKNHSSLWHNVHDALESTKDDAALFEKLSTLIQQHKMALP